MHINEIVFTNDLLDAGLCVGQESDGTPIIHGRHSYLNPDCIYGGVKYVDWVASGVYTTKYTWDLKTNVHMSTQDVINIFNIDKNCLIKTPCLIEENEQEHLEALTNYLSQCKCVNKKYAKKLALKLMTKFSIKIKVAEE